VAAALRAHDLAAAVEYAAADPVGVSRGSAGQITCEALVTAYLDDLLDRDVEDSIPPAHTACRNWSQFAASECCRLIGLDEVAWEGWVSLFARRGVLHEIAPYIPLERVALGAEAVERILYALLEVDSETFLRMVQK
jgi:hypothetical protein